MRNDSEKHYKKNEIDTLIEAVKSKYKLTKSDLYITSKLGYLKPDEYKELIYEKIQELSSAKLIITDRFHGIIFSLVSNTPVIVIDSADFKVSEGARLFSKQYPNYIIYAENITDVPTIVDDIMHRKFKYDLSSYYKEKFYDKLKVRIEESNT